MPKTVLLADDSLVIQRVVELTFANEDVRVVAVADGVLAIEAIRQSPPDLVLVDTDMPGRSGYEIARYIRSQPDLSNVPVLLLAAAFEPVDPTQAHEAGADGVLSKPFDPAVLVARVKELLAGGRPVAPSAPVVEADRYFEQIDEAFAALSKAPRAPLSALDEEFASEEPDSRGASPASLSPTPVPLPDAFAALLDAERTARIDGPARAGAAMPVAPPALDVDALAEQIARRVLEQLTDRVVRETVTDLATSTTERLVREEIERIKRNIK